MLHFRKVSELLKDLIKNPKNYLQARKGADFEQRIRTKLLGFLAELKESDFSHQEFKELKKLIGEKNTEKETINCFSNFKKHFVFQPLGSQNYPDFILFLPKFIIPIEVKFSEKEAKKPVWNSNLPRHNGFYLFGNYKYSEIVIFKGEFVLSKIERKKLISFWEKIKENEKNFLNNLKKMIFPLNDLKLEYGFVPYARRAYDQTKKINKKAITNFFDNPNKNKLTKKTIEKMEILESSD